MSTETILDRFGRVLIPKSVRVDLGLEPGAVLRVEERDEGILLQPVQGEPHLVVKEGVLVFTGSVGPDIVEAVRRDRGKRLKALTGRRKR